MGKNGNIIIIFIVILSLSLNLYSGNIERAVTMIKNGEYQKSIDLLESELNFDLPQITLLKIYNNLGIAYNKIGDYKKAIQIFQNALEIQSDNPELYYNLANTYVNNNEIGKAILNYKKCLALKKDFPEVYNNLGSLYIRQKIFDKAIEIFSMLVEKNEYVFEYNFNLAIAYLSTGQTDQSKKYLTKIIQSDKKPEHVAKAFLQMGVLYGKNPISKDIIKDYDEGIDRHIQKQISIFQQGLKKIPENIELMFNLGLAYLSINRLFDAITQFNKVIEHDNQYAAAYKFLGIALSKQKGAEDEAIINLLRSIQLNPSDLESRFVLGMIYTKKQEFKLAVKNLVVIINNSPYSDLARYAYFNLGNIFYRIHEYDDAIKYYKKGFQLDPDNPKLYFNLSLIYSAKKDSDNAIKYLKKAIELDSDFVEAYVNLSVLYAKKGLDAEAKIMLDKANNINPTVEGIYNKQLIEQYE